MPILSGYSKEDIDAATAPLLERLSKAERTLELAGYTDAGGELWKPPLGPSASPLLEKIAELERELETVRKDAERYRWLRGEAQWLDGVPQAIIWRNDGHSQEICAEEELDAAIDAAKERT